MERSPALVPSLSVLFIGLWPIHHCRAQFATAVSQISGSDHTAAFEPSFDPFGNLFVTGVFRGTCDFDPGVGTYPVVGIGLDNIWVARYGTDRTPDWVARLGGGAWLDQPRGLATGSLGQCVVAGIFLDSGDFDPGPGISTLSALHESDIYVAQLDSSGALDWLIHLPDSSYDQVWDVGIDSDNNVYMTVGGLDSVDLDPGPGTTLAYSPFGVDGLVKYDQNGAYVWSALLPVNFEQLFIDTNDNVLAVGEFSSTFDLDPGLGVTLVDAADGEMLVVEYAPNGTVNWYTQFAQTVPGSWGLRVADIEKDQNNDLVITGALLGTGVDLDPGPGQTMVGSSDNGDADWFCMKISTTGIFQWGVAGGSTYNEYISDLTLTTSGSVHLAVSYGGPHDVDPGPGSWMVDPHGAPTFNSSDDDALLLTLSATGVFEQATPIWALGGVYFAGTMWGPMGELIAVGYFSDSLTFGPPNGTGLLASGLTDVFICELDPEFQTGLPEIAPNTLFAYPNPATTEARVVGMDGDVVALQLYDTHGRQVLDDAGRSPGSNRIDVSRLDPGSYFLRVICSGGGVLTGKLMVAATH
ncbi:MAG: T9SS type A sorting domain-containing protein [Flavobacteriales bacterium]|nr:T9SS type A sorting domain-containing protein [Flavobacteriales bacterium]